MAKDAKPWPEVPVGNKDHTNAAVVIIGAGLSGMCTAIDLIKRNNCRNFIILEKSAGVGGTWHDNKYPGCCCDVKSMLYSYSFAQKSDWSRLFPGQEEILDYLVHVAQDYNLFQHVRFNTTVDEARWDDAEKKWKTKVTTAAGSKEAEYNPQYEIKSDFLVSAVGQLNVPKFPDIKGIDDFTGKKMHSARWDWTYGLEGKNIALIGNGCTSVQILPEIANVAKHTTVFQRTPNWLIPRLDQPVSQLTRNMYKYIPPTQWRVRGELMDQFENGHDFVKNPNSAVNKEFRTLGEQLLDKTFGDDPEMKAKLLPKYSPGCKRVIYSDDYYPALKLPNVKLETRPIDHISSKAVNVKNDDGSVAPADEEDYDLLVLATGFQTLNFMHPIKIYGRNGRPLSEIWAKAPRAYLGVSVEDLPNFGMLYGPNTNLGHNSIILMIETQSRYINGLVKPVLKARREGKKIAMYPKLSKLDEYNDKLQSELKNSSFGDPQCNSWYKNEAGLITNNWSGTVVQYQKMLSNVHIDDYEVEGETGVADVHVGRVVEERLVSDMTMAALGVLSVAAVAGSWFLRNSRYLHAITGN